MSYYTPLALSSPHPLPIIPSNAFISPVTYIETPVSSYNSSAISRITTVCLRVFDFMRTVRRYFFYEERRLQNPHLFIAGALLEYQIGQENKFLVALSKVITLSRALHSSIQSILKITQDIKEIVRVSSNAASLEAHGYLFAYNESHSWNETRQRAPSFNISDPFLSLVIRKAELIWEEIKELLWDLFQACERICNLKDIIFDIDQCQVRDILLELYDLYRMYDVNDSNSLLRELIHISPEIDYTLKALGIEGSSRDIFETMNTVFQQIKQVENTLVRATIQGSLVAQRTSQIANSMLTLPPRPLVQDDGAISKHDVKKLA